MPHPQVGADLPPGRERAVAAHLAVSFVQLDMHIERFAAVERLGLLTPRVRATLDRMGVMGTKSMKRSSV